MELSLPEDLFGFELLPTNPSTNDIVFKHFGDWNWPVPEEFFWPTLDDEKTKTIVDGGEDDDYHIVSNQRSEIGVQTELSLPEDLIGVELLPTNPSTNDIVFKHFGDWNWPVPEEFFWPTLEDEKTKTIVDGGEDDDYHIVSNQFIQTYSTPEIPRSSFWSIVVMALFLSVLFTVFYVEIVRILFFKGSIAVYNGFVDLIFMIIFLGLDLIYIGSVVGYNLFGIYIINPIIVFANIWI